MNNKLRFIQIGLGGFGKVWCQNIIPQITDYTQLVAAVDVNVETHKNAVEFCGLPLEKCYTSLRKALEENKADFITIVIPPAFHEEAVDIAIEFGCDIVCEKPYGDSIESSCRIYKKVKRAGRKMIITMSHRFAQDKQTLEAMIKSDKYGELNYIYSRLAMMRHRLKFQQRGNGHNLGAAGMISEATIHQLDIIRAMSGSNAKTVYAQVWSPEWHKDSSHSIADSCYIMIEMENGVHAVCEQSFVNATILNEWGRDYIRAECKNATLELDNHEIQVRSHLGFPFEELSKIKNIEKEKSEWTHLALLRLFANWVNDGTEPLCSIEDNLQCAALTYAAIESTVTGKAVDVQEYLRFWINKIQ